MWITAVSCPLGCAHVAVRLCSTCTRGNHAYLLSSRVALSSRLIGTTDAKLEVMANKNAFAEAMMAVSAVAQRSRTGTMAMIDPEETVASGEYSSLGDETLEPKTGTLPIVRVADVVLDVVPEHRAKLASLTVNVSHDLSLQDEASVPDVFAPRTRALSHPDGRGEIRLSMASSPKLRPLTYSLLASSEGPAVVPPAPEPQAFSGRMLASIFTTVLLATMVVGYFLVRM